MDDRIWKPLLLIGIVFHILAAFLMPVGLDAHVHATYVTDEMDDGEAHLEWGKLRADSPDGSVPEEVSSDDKWFFWHAIMEMWFSLFGASLTTLHIIGLIAGLGCLATIFLVTKSLFGPEQALRLTALASIYPPLIRAAGRFYQEGPILILVTLSVWAVIKAMQSERKLNSWWLIPFICAIIILSFKGMPLWYVLPAGLVLLIWSKSEIRMLAFIAVAIAVELVIVWRNGISLTEPDLVPALLSSFIGAFIFVYCAMLVFERIDGEETELSRMLENGTRLVSAGLIGWIAALWVTEAHALDMGFFDIILDYRNNPRYLSLVFIPLWYARLTRTGATGIGMQSDRKKLVAGAIILMILINIAVLSATGTRGSEIIGSELAEQANEEDDILFISDSSLAMHRMYSIRLTFDPDNDGENLAYWRTSDSGWQDELAECSEFSDVDWIVNFPNDSLELPPGWIEVELDAEADDWALYKWGGEDARCS